MRWTSVLLVAIAFSACSGDAQYASPTAPGASTPLPSAASSSPKPRAFVLVFVVANTGTCLEDVTVKLLLPGHDSQSTRQVTPCDAWGDSGGALFKDLPPGIEVTVRSSVAGYAPAEAAVTTTLDGHMAIELVPVKLE